MYHAASNAETEYSLQSINTTDEYIARLAFGLDFPEYYWFSSNVKFEQKKVTDALGFFDCSYFSIVSDHYDFNTIDIYTIQKEIMERINRVIPSLKEKDDYHTIDNVIKYVSNLLVYDKEYYEMSDIRAAFLYNKGVCSSYANTFQILCNKLGYECYSVRGSSIDINGTIDKTDNYDFGSDHMWNIIKIGNKWYWVDPTWADANAVDSYGNDKMQYINYSYFLVPDEIFFIDHECDRTFKYPNCFDDSFFLFGDIGSSFNSFNKNSIDNAIEDAILNDRNDYFFQFKRKKDLDSLVSWIKNKGFFDVYDSINNIKYRGSIDYYSSNNYSIYLTW